MVAWKLIHKLAVLAIMPVILSMIVFGSVSYSIYKEKLIQERIEEATSLIDLSAEEIKNPLYFLELNKLNAIIQNIQKNPNVISVYILDPNGRVITDGTTENKLYNQVLKDDFTLDSLNSNKTLFRINNNILLVSAPSYLNEKIGLLRMEFSLKEINQVISDLIILLSIIGIITLAGAFIIDIVISRKITNPVLKLRTAALEIASGNLDTKIDLRSGDEIGELAEAFKKMTKDLRTSRSEIISSRDYTENIVNSMADTLLVLSPDCKIQTINPAFCTLLGYTEKDLKGKPVNHVIADVNDCHGLEYDALINNRSINNVEKIYLSRDAKKIPVVFSASIMRDNNGAIQGIVCVAHDITERKRAEELLKEKARADIFGFLVSALPVFASGVTSQTRDTLVATFAKRFEMNMRQGFEEEMERTGCGRNGRETGAAETVKVMEAYASWLKTMFSSLGVDAGMKCSGKDCIIEFGNCPWAGDARGNPVFCIICRAMVMRSFIWTSLNGMVMQTSSIAGGGKNCNFEIKLHPAKRDVRQNG